MCSGGSYGGSVCIEVIVAAVALTGATTVETKNRQTSGVAQRASPMSDVF